MPLTTDFEFDVFLSHNAKDKPKVRKLAERLKAAGLRVWFDEWVIQPGDDIYLTIERGLEASHTLMLCLSPAALGSDWVKLERSTVLFRDPSNAGRRFIPLLLADCKLPDTLRRYKYVDMRQETDAVFDELVQAIENVPIQKPDQQQPEVPSGTISLRFDDRFVRPLHVTEDRFLQVLLSRFSLHRRRERGKESFELRVAFDNDAPAIWNHSGKQHLRKLLSPEKRAEYQTAFENFLLHGRGADDYPVKEHSFVFRFSSGGTLPIVSFSREPGADEYYCLFFRDAHPVGWNIANGGSDTRAELLNPQAVIERELREELVIADLANDKRYVFPGDGGKPIDHPAFAVARELWARKCPDKNVAALNTAEVEIEWMPCHDSLRIQIGDDRPVRRQGFLLNVNGEDFGIEFDRVAKIHISDHATLFDGEIDDGELVNRPIGLFKTQQFNRTLEPKAQFAHPEIVFYGAERYDGSSIDYIVRKPFMGHLEKLRGTDNLEQFRYQLSKNEQFALCPVTRHVIERWKKLQLESGSSKANQEG